MKTEKCKTCEERDAAVGCNGMCLVCEGKELAFASVRFQCPICQGEATLIEGDNGPEFCCLDCPIDIVLADEAETAA